jgi:hypothetical protein
MPAWLSFAPKKLHPVLANHAMEKSSKGACEQVKANLSHKKSFLDLVRTSIRLEDR